VLKARKTAAKNEKGNGTKSPPKSILRKKGKPAASNPLPKKEVCKYQRMRSRQHQQRYHAQQQKEEAEQVMGLI
jgi:hypothetical protein